MSLKADEVSQLTGLPLSRVEKALARLQTEPGRLEYGKLGKTEQTIAQMVQKPARRIQPPEGTLSIQQIQSTLLATINNLEQLPSRSKELRQQCLEWAAKLMAINTSLDERQDGILIVTNRGEVVYANRACQLLTGTTREQLKADSQTAGNPSLQALDRANFGLSRIELPAQNGSQISVQLLKLEVQEASNPDLRVAVLYKLRPNEANPPSQTELKVLKQALSNIRLYASLLVYGDSEQSANYQKHMIQEVQSLSNSMGNI